MADKDRATLIATSDYLNQLLERPGPYQQRWRRKLVREDGKQAAIAEVIARHLASYGHPEDLEQPRQLRSRVSRALARSGQDVVLSRRTLKLFIEAFDMSEGDANRLLALHGGSAQIRYVRGDPEVKLPVFDAQPRRHRTVSMREYHYLGEDGLPIEHSSDQVIEAIEDGLDRYPYIADTSMLTLDVQSGGKPSPTYQLRAQDGNLFHAIDIVLGEPLPVHGTASLRYTATFHYTDPPPPEMRRAFRTKVDSYLLWLQFHPNRVPSSIWWARWDSLDSGRVIDREQVNLDAERQVHRFLEGGVEQAIIGFYWEW